MREQSPSEAVVLEDSCVESSIEEARISAADIAFVAHAHRVAAEINSKDGNKEGFVPWGRSD